MKDLKKYNDTQCEYIHKLAKHKNINDNMAALEYIKSGDAQHYKELEKEHEYCVEYNYKDSYQKQHYNNYHLIAESEQDAICKFTTCHTENIQPIKCHKVFSK